MDQDDEHNNNVEENEEVEEEMFVLRLDSEDENMNSSGTWRPAS